jgi:hypothetical protein
VKIFTIIVEMNRECVTTNFMNPFDFEQKRKEITDNNDADYKSMIPKVLS